jgi:allantoate deiminase
MRLRYDALAAAAEWISAVERHAQEAPGLVATVGKIEARPGAINVIAGEARTSLDVRHGVDDTRTSALDYLIRQAEEIARRRELFVSRTVLLNQPAVTMDSLLVNEIERAIRQTGCEPHRMVSGAGHDAVILAEKVPAAMIFLRSLVNQHDHQSVEVEDMARAIECGVRLLDQLASSSEFQQRICRA